MKADEKIRGAVYTHRYVYNFHFPLIRVTKYRNRIFSAEKLSAEMSEILTQIAKDNDIVIENMKVMPDCVELLIRFPPRKSAVNVIKALKGRSAFLFLERHPEIRQSQNWSGHLWSSSYYMSTLGNMSRDVVEKYISDQKYNKIKNRPYKNRGADSSHP